MALEKVSFFRNRSMMTCLVSFIACFPVGRYFTLINKTPPLSRFTVAPFNLLRVCLCVCVCVFVSLCLSISLMYVCVRVHVHMHVLVQTVVCTPQHECGGHRTTWRSCFSPTAMNTRDPILVIGLHSKHLTIWATSSSQTFSDLKKKVLVE